MVQSPSCFGISPQCLCSIQVCILFCTLLPRDGIVGPKTTVAVISADPEWLLTRYLLRRARYYAEIIKGNPSQAKYLNGWFNRLDSVTNAAWEVIGGSASVARS